MGHKVNPAGRSSARYKGWRSKWAAGLHESPVDRHGDIKIRNYLKSKLQVAAVAKIKIERAWDRIRVTIFTARPHLVTEKGGHQIELMTADLTKICGGSKVSINIYEITNPDLNAQLVAENIALHLERGVFFRRAMKRAVQTSMKAGALGIRIRVSGRLGGDDIARAEWFREGKVRMDTLRATLNYGFTEVHTDDGRIIIKVWINNPIVKESAAKSDPILLRPKDEVLSGGAVEVAGAETLELLAPGDSTPSNLLPAAIKGIEECKLSLLIPGVSVPIPLSDLELLFDGWNATNQRRFDLITRESELTDPEREELARLQNLAEAKVVLTMPLPIARLKKIEAMFPPNGG